MRGRKPVPSAVLALEGRRVRPGGRAVAEPVAMGAPEMPEWLSEYAAEEWELLVPALRCMGIIAAVDRGVLAAYCCALGDLRQARELMALQAVEGGPGAGLVEDNADGTQRRGAAWRIARDAAADVVKYAAELGASAISRARLGIILGQGREPDRFGDLLYGRVSGNG